MKKFFFTLTFLMLGSAYIYSQTTLSFRITNPQIIYTYNDNANAGAGLNCINLKWDVEMKASASNTRYYNIGINQNYNAAALADFIYIPDPTGLGVGALTSRYTITTNTNSGNLNLFITSLESTTSAASARFMLIPTSYMRVGTFICRITDPAAVAGIKFIPALMDGQQFEKIFSPTPGLQVYSSPNIYEGTDLTNLYLGRVYSAAGWSQYGGSTLDVLYTDWATSVNTSIWEGTATVPTTGTSMASALRIHSPATLTIPNTGKLTVSGATQINTSNGLVIQSDATGTGSLITGSATGSATAQRYMTSGRWHMVSSPLSGQSIANFLTTNSNIPTNGSARGMMDYDPATNSWNSFFTNLTAGNAGAGKGFSMRVGASSAAVTFNGTLQTGDQSAAADAAFFNCVGNPYTSAIHINELSDYYNNFITVNAANLDPLNGSLYVWDQPDASNGQTGKYTVISNASPSFDVQQGQAFFVKMDAGKTSLNFTSAMQLHNTALALKSTERIWPTIKLEATFGEQKSSTIIAFNNGMTNGLDRTYDAGLLKGPSDLVVYTRLVEDIGVPFAIQALPANDYSSMIIPVGLDFKTGGEVVFSSELINLPSDCKVILEDKFNKTFTDLSKKTYSITASANSSLSDRFQIHTSTLTTGLGSENLTGKLNAYAVRNEILLKGEVSKQAIATLYDVQGRMVLVKNLEKGDLNIISAPFIRNGIYMLFVKDNERMQGFKISIIE